jgi:hypothetical protein
MTAIFSMNAEAPAWSASHAYSTSLFHHRSFLQSIADLGGGTLNAILTLTLLLFVVLIPFVGFGEL